MNYPPSKHIKKRLKHETVYKLTVFLFVGSLQNESSVLRRRELLEGTSNLAAMPAPDAPSPSPDTITIVFPRSSGSFPALTTAKKRIPPLIPPSLPPTAEYNNNTSSDPPRQFEEETKGSTAVWLYVVIGVAAFVAVLIVIAVIFFFRKRAVKTIGPWKTGLSGQLQKAFVTGKKMVLKLFFILVLF